jgi:hypothetical protein
LDKDADERIRRAIVLRNEGVIGGWIASIGQQPREGGPRMSSKARSDKPIPVSPIVQSGGFTLAPQGPDGLTTPGQPQLPQAPPVSVPIPFPPLHLCRLNFAPGCYQLRITNTPNLGHFLSTSYRLGTLRVGTDGSSYAVSGDTYRYSLLDILIGSGIPSFGPTTIPIYPRSRYNSYFKVTAVNVPFLSTGTCKIHLVVEEYDYTQPASGSFDGTFPVAASRTMDIYLMPTAPPVGFTGPYFTGQIYIGGVVQPQLSMTLAWVSPMFRKATVEVHTMLGAVAPSSVPIPAGSEYFDTIYAKASWELTVLTDPNPVPVPAGVVPTNPWTHAALHNVMTALSDYTSVDLDDVWYVHVLVVQAQLGSGRGVMFDDINVPREGVATFCDDGYPSGESAWFGTAANQEQKNVPRAFLRSGTHEITHGFNQIHQELEGGADNSIMTTTPNVAESIHAAGGTFPNDIILDFNEHVRHHLGHLPDPVVRPGGMTFTAGHNGIPVPSEDDDQPDEAFEHPSIEVTLKAQKTRLKLGEPLHLRWEMRNKGKTTVMAPNFVGIEHEFAEISVLKPDGVSMDVAPFVIVCDAAQLTNLAPGETRSAEHDLFWSTQGFAFESPGKHTVAVDISWRAYGAKVRASDAVEILIDYPVTERDNEVIAQMMDPEVGRFIALGGHAYHLRSATTRIGKVVREQNHEASRALTPFYDEKLAAAHIK